MSTLRESAGPRDFVVRGGGVFALVSLLVGLAGSAVMVPAFASEPERAFHSYLTAYVFVVSSVVGTLGFVMIAHAANTTWPVVMRRLGEATIAALPLVTLLFVPLLFGLGRLYPWMSPDAFPDPVRRALVQRGTFMNARFFAVRTAGYLVLWSLLALRLRGLSLAVDHGGAGVMIAARLRRTSYVGLVVLTITTAFAGFDWLMSLDAEFASTMFGAYFVGTCLFGGTAWLVLLLALADSRGFSPPFDASHYHALGRLLLAFLIFVGYLAFFQYLLCWIGNKPDEVGYYLARRHGAYGWESLFLVLGHLFLPFFALLSFQLKRRRQSLLPVAVWCLFAHYLHVHWLVTPTSPRPGFSWLDLAALAAVSGLTFAFASVLQRGKSAIPTLDPRYAASVAYRSR
jgi:hypothetical protein